MRTPSEMSGQLLLLDLARGVPRELLDKAYVAGHFVPRQVVLDVLLDGIGVESRPRSGRDVGAQSLPELLVVDADDRDLDDVGESHQAVLDLLREDVLTTRDDHVVVAPLDEQQPVTHSTDIAGRHRVTDRRLAS